MFIRNIKDLGLVIGGRQFPGQAKANLYPTAYPFDRANQGNPSSVAFAVIHGIASGVTSAVDCWGQAIVRTLPTSGFTIGISSSSANDVNTSGTGAWVVEVDVLDVNYKPYTFTYNLNGTTKVTDTNLVGTAFRINDIRIKDFGTGLANAGDIYVYDSSDTVTAGVPQTATKIFHKIVAGENVSRGGFYTVPAGCQMQTQQFRGGYFDLVTTTRAATMRLQFSFPTPTGKLIQSYYPMSGAVSNGTGYIDVSPDFPVLIDEKTDVSIRVASSASATIAAYLDVVLFYK